MEIERYLDTKFTPNYNQIMEWLRDDQTERALWDQQSIVGWRIRNSQLPTTEPIENVMASKGVYFKDNWVKKSATWLTSYLTGATVYGDVKSYDGIYRENMELLENELNFAMSLGNYSKAMSLAVLDWFYVGYGVTRTYFDTRRINNFWKTGTPIIEHIDARNCWYKCPDSYLSDIVRFFHAEAVDTTQLKREIAEYSTKDSEKISETSHHRDAYFPEIKGKTIVYTGVFKQVERIKKREFIYESIDMETGQPQTENWFEFEEEYQDSGIEELPENVFVSPEPVDIDVDCYYQVVFIPSAGIIKKQPIKEDGEMVWKDSLYVGDKPSYHILGGNTQDGSQYPYGQAYDLKDILDLSVVFMSSLSKQIGNMNRPQPQIFEDAIVNLNDFMNNHWKSNFTTILDPEFFAENPNLNPQEAVTYKQTPINDRLFLVMQNYITEAIKSSTGAVDSARGEQQYSGQSGVLANQLQLASQTYLKNDENKYREFLNSILNWLMKSIVKYRDMPHVVKGLDPEGDPIPREVNTTVNNTLKDDDYYAEANLKPNAENEKQMEKQRVLELLSAGKFPLKQALEILDLSSVNVKQTIEELQREQGIAQIAELINKYPELQGQIMAMAQQLEQQGSMQQQTPKE